MEYEYLDKEKLYKCFYCKYDTTQHQHMKTHCKSKRHINNINSMGDINDVKAELGLICEYCQKTFKNKHLVKMHQYRSCKIKKQEDMQKEQEDIQKTESGEDNPVKQPQYANTIINNGDTINNNNVIVNQHFNLQVYLNEDCKEAIDLSEFTRSIKITMEDLLYVGNNGFAEGMTKLIVDNLQKLDVQKRPIQCSDAKRDVTYIKEGEWVKDQTADLMEGAIKQLNKDQYKAIGEWSKQRFPAAGTSAADDFHNILGNLNPGTDQKNINRVKKNIRNATAIDKSPKIDNSITINAGE
jgi:hypothetical protein